MTPFLQFRIWVRRASAAQLAAATLAGAVAIALLAWAAVPSTRSVQSLGTGVVGAGSAVTTGGGSGSGSGGTSGSGGSTGATGAGGSSAAGTGATSGNSGSGGSASVSGTGTGSTSGGGTTGGSNAVSSGTTSGVTTGGTTQTGAASCSKMGVLKIGVALPEAAGGTLNTIVGAPPVADEEADYSAVFDSVNKAGGVDCYDLSPDYFQADETNPSSVQSGCLQFVQDKVFAVLGGFEPASPDTCLLQNHLATIEQLSIPAGDAHQYYPYYLAADATYQTLYKNFVDASNQLGYFSAGKGFKKIGIFYRDCSAEVNQAMLSDLAAVGISGSKVDRADLGCPSEFANPQTIQTDLLQFKADGVTTVTFDNDIIDIQNISNQAATENFYPFWDFPDDGSVAITASANFHPNSGEFNGAVSISDLAYGAIASNLPLTPGTVACNKVMSSHKLPSVYQSPDNFAGSTCSLVWLLVAAIQHGGVNPADLAPGLQAAKTVQVSYPNGPNDFSAPGTTTGGEYWRPVTYHSSCQCWTVIKPNFSPSF